jgi:hypothetical protein
MDVIFRDGGLATSAVQVQWPPNDPRYLVTLEHLEDNDELVVIVHDKQSDDSQPECVWSSVGLDQ